MKLEEATKEAVSFLKRDANIHDARAIGTENVGEVFLVQFESAILERTGFVLVSTHELRIVGFKRKS